MRLQALFLGVITLGSVISGAVVRQKETPEPVPSTKYFHEPGITDLTRHYDARYFKEMVDYDERRDTLRYLAKAWLQTTAKEGIETWIAHGTLLGWWWNGNIFPWDWDLDVQMSAKTLTMLGEKYNMSRHHYSSEDGKETREYLLDVNPWIWQRVRGDGNNIIDARWIDTRNGLYIDITGVAETNPETTGILSCKNLHRYKIDDIWPLRDTLFEGVPAKIPYNFDEILMKEYNAKALVVTEYEGHRWNTHTKAWDLAPEVPSGKEAEDLLRRVREPEKYSTVESGGFLYNAFRLLHWW